MFQFRKSQDLASKKALLRETVNRQWFELSSKERLSASQAAVERLLHKLDAMQAKCVLFYASMEDEPFTDDVIDTWLTDPDLKLILTRVCAKTKQLDPRLVESWDDLQVGRFGIRMPKKSCQPIDLVALDAVVVPGRAFDLKKNRVGRGYGFYDRFLSVVPTKVKRIGLALEFQVQDEVPVEEHDIPMDVVVTEHRTIDFSVQNSKVSK